MHKHCTLVGTAAALLVAVLAGTALAGGGDRLGTAGAMELRIPVGPRGTALAGAMVASASGAEALFWNPAGIAADRSNDILLTHTEYLGTLNVEYAGIVSRMGSAAVGASFKALTLGNIIVTTEDAPNGTGEIASPTFTVAEVALAKQMTDKVRFGGSASLVNEHLLQESAVGISFDFGFQYDPQWNGLQFGFAMKNFGSNMRFDGSDFERSIVLPNGNPQSQPTLVKTTSASFELPSFVTFGVSKGWDIGARSHADLNAVFQNNNFSDDEYRVGGEFLAASALALRAGYVYSQQDNYIYDWTAGAGWMVPLDVAHASVNYTYTHVKHGWFDAEHAFSVGVKF